MLLSSSCPFSFRVASCDLVVKFSLFYLPLTSVEIGWGMFRGVVVESLQSIMYDTSHQLQVNRLLGSFSERLDELLYKARRHELQLPPELLDEIAATTGEIMLVLMNFQENIQTDALLREALTHAGNLRQHLRTRQLRDEEIAEAFSGLKQEVEQLVYRSRRAA